MREAAIGRPNQTASRPIFVSSQVRSRGRRPDAILGVDCALHNRIRHRSVSSPGDGPARRTGHPLTLDGVRLGPWCERTVVDLERLGIRLISKQPPHRVVRRLRRKAWNQPPPSLQLDSGGGTGGTGGTTEQAGVGGGGTGQGTAGYQWALVERSVPPGTPSSTACTTCTACTLQGRGSFV